MYASCWYPTREKGGHLIVYGQSQTSALQMVQMFEIAHTWLNDHPHTGLTLHQISPGHTYWKFHVPINQAFHLGMLIMHILHAVISPFSSFSCSKPGKRNALDQREFLLHHGLIWHLYEPKPCDPFLPVPWCVPNLLHCTVWSPTCDAAGCGTALVHVKQASFRRKWTGGSAPDVQLMSIRVSTKFWSTRHILGIFGPGEQSTLKPVNFIHHSSSCCPLLIHCYWAKLLDKTDLPLNT